MIYTTHGGMTPADLDDYRLLTDTGAHPGCPGHWTEEEQMIVRCSANDECPGEDDECPL